MKLISYLSAAVVISAAALTACQDDYENVENRVYDTSALTPTSVLIDGQSNESLQTFSVSLANPAPRKWR